MTTVKCMSLYRKKVTLKTLLCMKNEGTPASFITAYDYPSACYADEAEIEMILVGDSGGMTMLGYKNTMPVTMNEMLHFTKAVCRGAQHSFVIGDMPFLSYQVSNREAIRNAGKFMQVGCDAIKLEGGRKMYDRIKAISNAGIPVMAHLGLTPQSLSLAGGYRVYGKNLEELAILISDAQLAEKAGASFLLLEAIPEDPAGIIRDSVDIPVYGIGAGSKLDGQLLILHDLIGSFVGDIKPRFAKRYAFVGDEIKRALSAYRYEVRQGFFPDKDHNYPIEQKELELIHERYSERFPSTDLATAEDLT